MSTLTSSHAHNVTYAVDGIKSSLLQIVNQFGLSRDNLLNNWSDTEYAIKTWMLSGHLYKVTLEIFDTSDPDYAVGRVDMDIDHTSDHEFGDLGRWKNKDAVAAAMAKYIFKGANLKYRIMLYNRDGRPDVPGWGPTQTKKLDKLKQSHFGTTIGTSSVSVTTSVWSN